MTPIDVMYFTRGTRDFDRVKSKIWIVKGRSLVRGVISQRGTCRRFEGKQFPTPPPHLLPLVRVKDDPAFSFTGVNFAGPLLIHSENPYKTGKAWICLFTCFVTRAVHLDCSGYVYRHIHSLPEEICCSKGITEEIHLIMATRLRQPQGF